MERPKTIDEINQLVQESQGVITIQMQELRDSYGASRLGKMVRENISRELQGRGLSHYPEDLPDYQDEYVRVFKLGTPIADLIQAVLEPTGKNDNLIRNAVDHEAQVTLKKVRELVC